MAGAFRSIPTSTALRVRSSAVISCSAKVRFSAARSRSAASEYVTEPALGHYFRQTATVFEPQV